VSACTAGWLLHSALTGWTLLLRHLACGAAQHN
jgi:hypothetical protein